MVYRNLAIYLFIPCLFIAFILAINGASRSDFLNFNQYSYLKNVLESWKSWKFEIPKIPKIPTFNDVSFNSAGLILTIVIRIGNAVISFLNFQVTFFNVVISFANILITLFQFGLTMVYHLRDVVGQVVNG